MRPGLFVLYPRCGYEFTEGTPAEIRANPELPWIMFDRWRKSGTTQVRVFSIDETTVAVVVHTEWIPWQGGRAEDDYEKVLEVIRNPDKLLELCLQKVWSVGAQRARQEAR